ncbi:ATP-binding protein [Streptomyces sp. TRM68416]|uniref:ATP-binding protein n=1 Tax=Streptomyces sp. TRM68416 TaxID=2758412 RepID=UPI001661D9CC|nr:ATP-binding protein [Streptomyces sp. TRM68416]MBD0842250.1 ATP-binding protein [Streptomyces sp. TRM68416]
MRAHTGAAAQTARAEYTLPCTVTSAGRARRLTSSFLARPRSRIAPVGAEQVAAATLIASELVANAVRHGRTGCRLRLRVGAGHVTVEVRDDAPGRPRTRAGRAEDESGRGLAIVRILSERFDIVVPVTGGKTVRAVLAV